MRRRCRKLADFEFLVPAAWRFTLAVCRERYPDNRYYAFGNRVVIYLDAQALPVRIRILWAVLHRHAHDLARLYQSSGRGYLEPPER